MSSPGAPSNFNRAPRTPQKKKISVALIETTETANARAKDIAEAELNKEVVEAGSKGFVERTWARVWKNNLAYNHYRQKKIGEARSKIHAGEGNLFVDEQADRAAHEAAQRAVVEQFINEDAELTVHEEAGEKRAVLENTPEDLALREQVKSLVLEYAQRDLNDPAVQQAFAIERARLIDEQVAAQKAEVLDERIGNRQRMFADNLLEAARAVQESIRHGNALDAADLDFEVVVGRARAGVRTEVDFDRVDRIVDKLHKVAKGKLGMFVNETTLAAGVSIGYTLIGGIAKRVASSRLAAFGTLGATAALAGAFAWGKERRRMEKDRALHLRQRAMGKAAPEAGQERRGELEESRYEIKTAGELQQSLEQSLFGLEQGAPDLPQLRDAAEALAEVEKRIELSDQKKIDLIAFSDPKQVVSERFELDVLRAKLRVAMRTALDGNAELAARYTNDQEWRQKQAEVRTSIEADVEQKDRLFKKLKGKNAFNAGIKAAAVGLVFGATLQEMSSWIRADQRGLIEGIVGRIRGGEAVPAPAHLTAFEWLRVKIMAEETYAQIGGPAEKWIGSNQIHMPEGFELRKVPAVGSAAESYTLMRDGVVAAEGLTFTTEGLPTPEALEILKGHHMVLSAPATHTESVTERLPGGAPAAPSSVPMSEHDYLVSQQENMHAVKRVLWYDNDTPKFDKNELRLWRGGVGDTGIDAKGDYVYSVRALMEQGSYHQSSSINARELMKEGKLSLLLSVSKGTQNLVFEVPIDSKGNAIIERGSEAWQRLFEKDAQGKAQFTGGFMEVAQTVGTKDGVSQVRILATDIGKNSAELPPVPQEPEPTPIKRWSEMNLMVPADPLVDPPPVVPIVGRKPLEEKDMKSVPIGPSYYGYYGSGTEQSILDSFERRGISLDPYFPAEKDGKSVWVDKEGDPIIRDVARERARINRYLRSGELAHKQEVERLSVGLPPMDERCRVAVLIPARFESANLANLLDQYSKQVDKNNQPLDPNTFEINILVNLKRSETPDDSVRVINQWKTAHPDIHVNAIDVAFDDAVARVGLARRVLTDITLRRSVNRRSQTGSLYLESEDADVVSVDRRTISKLTDDFDLQPSVDVLRGTQDRQPEVLVKNDLLFFSRRLWDFAEIFLRNPKFRPTNNAEADFVWHRVISGGWNTAYSAEAYVQVGGHDTSMGIGEDMDIGQKISVLRGSKDQEGRFVHNTWTAKASGLRMSSSPRRFIDGIDQKINPYDDFENQAVKKIPINELLQRISNVAVASRGQQQRYQDEIDKLSSLVSNISGTKEAIWKATMVRTLAYLGLREGAAYTINGRQVVLRPEGMDTIIARIQKYKQEDRWKLGYRRQNNSLGV